MNVSIPITVALFIVFTSKSYSQLHLIITENSTYIGRNISTSLTLASENHTFSIGIKYHINSRVHDLNPDNYFKRRFWATTWSQHMGVDLGYQYHFTTQLKSLNPFIFYNLQFTRANINADRYLPKDNIGGIQTYQYIKTLANVTTALEQTIGIGFTMPLFKKISLYQKFGTGIASFHGLNGALRKVRKTIDISYLISVGVVLQLNSSNKS